jgi:hypothetical protein
LQLIYTRDPPDEPDEGYIGYGKLRAEDLFPEELMDAWEESEPFFDEEDNPIMNEELYETQPIVDRIEERMPTYYRPTIRKPWQESIEADYEAMMRDTNPGELDWEVRDAPYPIFETEAWKEGTPFDLIKREVDNEFPEYPAQQYSTNIHSQKLI